MSETSDWDDIPAILGRDYHIDPRVLRTRTFSAILALTDATPADVLKHLLQRPTEGTTHFWREANLGVFADQIANPLRQRLGRDFLKIAQVGCSTGQETWSLAALLENHQVPFTLCPTDVNPQLLEKYNPPRFPAAFVNGTNEYGRVCHLFTSPDSGMTLMPNAAVQARVQPPKQHDIIRGGPLPGRPFDAIFCNNLLPHMTEHGRTLALRHMVGSLAAGGVFVFEAKRAVDDPQYGPWIDRLKENFGLAPMPEAGGLQCQIRRYTPPRRQTPGLPGRKELSAAGSGSLVMNMGASAVAAVGQLPFDLLQAAQTCLDTARNALTAAGEGSGPLDEAIHSLAAAGERLRAGAAAMGASVASLTGYLSAIGLTGGGPANQ